VVKGGPDLDPEEAEGSGGSPWLRAAGTGSACFPSINHHRPQWAWITCGTEILGSVPRSRQRAAGSSSPLPTLAALTGENTELGFLNLSYLKSTIVPPSMK